MKRSIYYRPYLQFVRWPERLTKSVACLIIVCVGFAALTPAVVGAKTLARDAKLYAAPLRTEFDVASDALIALEDVLDRMDRRLNGKFEFVWQETLAKTSKFVAPPPATRAQLQTLRTGMTSSLAAFDAQQTAINAYLDTAHQGIQTASVSEGATWQRVVTDKYATQYAALKQKIAAIEATTSDETFKTAVSDAAAFLRANSSRPNRAAFDPNHLAFGPPKERPRAPLTSASAIQAALQLPDASGQTPVSAKGKDLPPSGSSNSSVTNVKSKDLATNLAPTEDVQITAAIRNKAAALNNNALAIYQFVRNNVQYMPTYGSIQGSDYTLQTMRGNDVDQASLLIALLRAANIPAHYVYGTIEVPIAQVENWVGGTTDANAAIELMGQGGIPVVGLTDGGVMKFARMEHVWVEAQLAFSPSRGAIASAGATWTPMDPSFKQYAFTNGMDLPSHASIDLPAMAAYLQQNSASNTSEGWVQNVDQTYVSNKITDYQAQMVAYTTNQNPNATLDDVIGKKAIITENLPFLPASLANPIDSVASRMDSLPATMRWAFHYSVDGHELVSQGLPSLAGHLLALNFNPATEQDIQTLASFFPANTTDPSQLPTTLPAGIVQMTSQFISDGNVIGTGPTYLFGANINVVEGLYKPLAGWQDVNAATIAGEYLAIGIDPAGIANAQLIGLKTKAQAVQDQIAAHNYSMLSKHDLIGSMMQSAVMNFFVQEGVKAQTAARVQGILNYRLPSFGTVSTYSVVGTLFGIPVQVASKGVIVDVPHLATMSVAKSGDIARAAAFTHAEGTAASRTESDVLEQGFSVNQQAAGVSAVQALAVANQQGQRIYTIDSTNASTAIPQLSVQSAVIREIADSVAAGRSVTVSQNMINYAGTNEVGYIISDPLTGAAAYKISSSANGGEVILIAGHPGVDDVENYMLQLLKLAGDHPFLTAFLAVAVLLLGEIGIFLGLIIGIISLASDLLQALNNSATMCTTLVNLVIGGVAGILFAMGLFAGFFTFGIGTVIALAIGGLLLSFLFAAVPTFCQNFGGRPVEAH